MKKSRKKSGEHRVPPTSNKSWRPGQKGQGGEGMSKGYGGSAGRGTGPSGPDTNQPHKEKSGKRNSTGSKQQQASSCLPSRERIEQVLR
jgi:hypothetical protein